MSDDGALYAAHNVIDEQLRWHEDGLASAIAHTLATAIEEHAGEVAQMVDEIFDRVEAMVASAHTEGPKPSVGSSSHMDNHTYADAAEGEVR